MRDYSFNSFARVSPPIAPIKDSWARQELTSQIEFALRSSLHSLHHFPSNCSQVSRVRQHKHRAALQAVTRWIQSIVFALGGISIFADRLQIDSITVGTLDNYFVLFDEFWPQTSVVLNYQEKSVCVLAHIKL
jgi:hypothetical protein